MNKWKTYVKGDPKRQEILDWLKVCTDPIVAKYQRDLTLNVPFRLQAPLYEDFSSEIWKKGISVQREQINQQQRLIVQCSAR